MRNNKYKFYDNEKRDNSHSSRNAKCLIIKEYRFNYSLWRLPIKIENGELKIDLIKIEGAGKVLEHATLSDITAEEKGLNIEASLNI